MDTVMALIIAITFMSSGGPGDLPKGRTLKVKVGQEFTLRIKVNPTTGYAWKLKEPLEAGKLTLVKREYVPNPAPKGMVGSGGVEVWTFKVLAKGKTQLKFIYARL